MDPTPDQESLPSLPRASVEATVGRSRDRSECESGPMRALVSFFLEDCLEAAIAAAAVAVRPPPLRRQEWGTISEPLWGDAGLLQELLQKLFASIPDNAVAPCLEVERERDDALTSVIRFRLRLRYRGPATQSDHSELHQIVQALGGDLQMGANDCEQVDVQLALCFPLSTRPEQLGKLSLSGLSILIVDDDRLSRMLAAAMLRALDGRVMTAVDGHEAIHLAGRYGFDLVFLDIEMPGMNGLETCEALRRLPQAEDLPIFALTSHRHHDLQHGFTGHITKPLDKATIATLFTQHVSLTQKAGRIPQRVSQGDQGPLLREQASTEEIGLVEAQGLADNFGDAPEVLELCLSLFERRSPILLDDLELGLARGEAERVSLLAHELKGMLANLWLPSLQALAAAIEGRARQGQLEGPYEDLQRLKLLIPKAVRELQKTIAVSSQKAEVRS